MTTHFEQSFQRDLEHISHCVTEMSALVERALEDCGRAVLEGNHQLAYAVILRDQYIDAQEKEIDGLCLNFLIRQQPVAGPLRFAYSAIKVNMILESAGDIAESIARQVLRLSSLPEAVSREGLAQLTGVPARMIRDAAEAFVRQNTKLAAKVIEAEDFVDGLKSKLNKEYVRLFQEGKIEFPSLNSLMMIVRHFERASDAARDICMETIYACTGQLAKHPGADEIRVVFVDEHNSCRGRMAEAYASTLGIPKMSFVSAGLEPEPVDPMTVAFMREKGFDLSMVGPKGLHEVPNLDRAQVIVALDRGVKRAFPRQPRKVVYLDWDVADPSRIKGTPEAVQAAYERTWQFIQSHVKDLADAILGSKKE